MIRYARKEDAPRILQLIKDLAEYEKAPLEARRESAGPAKPRSAGFKSFGGGKTADGDARPPRAAGGERRHRQGFRRQRGAKVAALASNPNRFLDPDPLAEKPDRRQQRKNQLNLPNSLYQGNLLQGKSREPAHRSRHRCQPNPACRTPSAQDTANLGRL